MKRKYTCTKPMPGNLVIEDIEISYGECCPRCGISPSGGVFDLFHPTDWPESRIDVIGQNGNDGLHYETTGTPGDRMNGGDTSQGHERPNTGSDAMTGGEQ